LTVPNAVRLRLRTVLVGSETVVLIGPGVTVLRRAFDAAGALRPVGKGRAHEAYAAEAIVSVSFVDVPSAELDAGGPRLCTVGASCDAVVLVGSWIAIARRALAVRRARRPVNDKRLEANAGDAAVGHPFIDIGRPELNAAGPRLSAIGVLGDAVILVGPWIAIR
jgi:hypothetical protein